MALSRVIGSVVRLMAAGGVSGAGIGGYLGYKHGPTFAAVARELSRPRPSDEEASEEATERAKKEFRNKICKDNKDEKLLAAMSTAGQEEMIKSLPPTDKTASDSNKETVYGLRVINALFHTDDKACPRSLARTIGDTTVGAALGSLGGVVSSLTVPAETAWGAVLSVVNATKGQFSLTPIVHGFADGVSDSYGAVAAEGLFCIAKAADALEPKKPSEAATTPPQAEDKPSTQKPGL